MSDPIVHRDLLRLLGLELDRPAQELRELLKGNPDAASYLADEVERSGLAEIELVLAQPISNHADGAPLVAGNVPLSPRKIRALLTRQAQDPSASIGPLVLLPSESVLGHYRRKITARIEGLVGRLRENDASNTKIIHSLIASSPEMTCIEEYFGELVDRVFTSPGVIPTVLPVVTSAANDAVLLNALDASFIAMAALLQYQKFATDEQRRIALTRVGIAALVQDFATMADPLSAEGHPEVSARYVEKVGLGEDVARLVRMHHSLVDEEGVPLLSKPDAVPVAARVLIATNVFVGEVRTKGPGQNFESIKHLSYLAEMGMIDRRVLQILSRMYLPRLKSFVLEKANQLAAQCPLPDTTPILWPITGDKVPAVFLCQSQGCEHRTAQLSHLAQDIPIHVDGHPLATIRKGEYFTCPFLTARLKSLYAAVKNQVKR